MSVSPIFKNIIKNRFFNSPDLFSERKIPSSKLLAFAKEIGAKACFECSALTGYNIEKTFMTAARICLGLPYESGFEDFPDILNSTDQVPQIIKPNDVKYIPAGQLDTFKSSMFFAKLCPDTKMNFEIFEYILGFIFKGCSAIQQKTARSLPCVSLAWCAFYQKYKGVNTDKPMIVEKQDDLEAFNDRLLDAGIAQSLEHLEHKDDYPEDLGMRAK